MGSAFSSFNGRIKMNWYELKPFIIIIHHEENELGCFPSNDGCKDEFISKVESARWTSDISKSQPQFAISVVTTIETKLILPTDHFVLGMKHGG